MAEQPKDILIGPSTVDTSGNIIRYPYLMSEEEAKFWQPLNPYLMSEEEAAFWKPADPPEPTVDNITLINNPSDVLVAPVYANITYGATGAMVSDMQTMLKELGYDLGHKGVDGWWGDYTDAAVRKFQGDNGLVVDGICGPLTMGKLKELYDKKRNVTSSTKLPDVIISSPVTDTYVASRIQSTPKTMSGKEPMVGADNLRLITIANLAFTDTAPGSPRIISFYGIAPDDITESHTAEFQSESIGSRSSPLAAYSGSGARTFDLSIDIHEDYISQFEKITLKQFIGRVKALTYPRYINGVVIPPRVFIKIGEFFVMKAYCSSVSVTWKKPLRDGKYYVAASLSMSFSEILSISFSADEVATGGDYARYGIYNEGVK